jgi:hypothetical protein
MLRSRRLTTVVGTLAFGLFGSGVAHATLLTFNGTACTGATLCSNGAFIDQNYGDTPGSIDVTYSHRVSPGNTAADEPSLKFWDNNYGDLQNVAWGGSTETPGVAEIRLTPLAGWTVTLNSFDFGPWMVSQNTQYTIFDGAYNVLFTNSILVPGGSHSHLTPGLSNPNGLILQWNNPYNVAIDNFDFTASTIEPSPVPEPATALLLGSGILALARSRSRRRRQ